MVFRNSVDGLDKVFRTDIDPPKVLLVTGPPGSMKTSFCYALKISDFTDLREIDQMVGETEQTNYLEFIEKMLAHFKKAHANRFKLFALDSLGALYSLMEDVSAMRKRMFYFFKMLRDYSLISLVVMERELGGASQLLGNEGFLVDGIIHLGLDRSRGKLTRYLQVEKMRACDHSVEKHALEVRKGGISVLGPIFEAGE